MSDIDQLVNTILRAQGRQRYLSDWDKELAQRLTASAAAGRVMPTIRPQGDLELRVAVTTFPAAKQRRFNYGECAKQRSDLYAKHVSVIAPDNPVTLTFRAAGRGKSVTWDGLRSDGWLIENGHWADVRTKQILDTRDVAMRLMKVRSSNRMAKTLESNARRDLAELISDRRQRVMRGDGVVAVTETAQRRSIDLDFAESVPDLAQFLTYTPRAEYTQVRFLKVAVDPEGDEQPWEGE